MALFVARLNPETTAHELSYRFSAYGLIEHCNVVPGKGFGFVEYKEPQHAEEAIDAMNGQKIAGSAIVVQWARGKDGSGGGSGSGSHNGGVGRARGLARICRNCGAEGHIASKCREPPRRLRGGLGSGDLKEERSAGPHQRGGFGGSAGGRTANKLHSRSRSPHRKSSRSRSGSPRNQGSRSRSHSPTHSNSPVFGFSSQQQTQQHGLQQHTPQPQVHQPLPPGTIVMDGGIPTIILHN
eukprot:TRINITY_DN9126_c0_g1_i1.p1 TRINITY_DN9126_c0_g1~~TRINITY_DN9126_c0_g1_i1.p1  ORF type:complete len:267 (+),score=29.57 TRINITY_DN9126_c0_g1_i1:86-802(+)